ncbi:WD40 repeat-like protein [Moniliophthora roreri]|nr:WD40 repeat-like protein [Moniliophthora roreri]
MCACMSTGISPLSLVYQGQVDRRLGTAMSSTAFTTQIRLSLTFSTISLSSISITPTSLILLGESSGPSQSTDGGFTGGGYSPDEFANLAGSVMPCAIPKKARF